VRPVKLRPHPGTPATTPGLESGPVKVRQMLAHPSGPDLAVAHSRLPTGAQCDINALDALSPPPKAPGERPDHDAWHEGNYSGRVPGS